MSTPSSRALDLGLIGASNIASRIVNEIRTLPNIHVSAVAAQRPGAAAMFAKNHGIGLYYSSYADLLQNPSIGAVYISTLNCDHARMIEASLKAGKHVICEKPMVTSLSEANQLFSLAQSRNLILLEGFMYRFHPQMKLMNELLNKGAIGKIKSIHINFSFRLYDLMESRSARATGKGRGGALLDLGCYGVDFINWTLKNDTLNPIISVQQLKDPMDADFDLSTFALFEFSNNVKASIHCAVDRSSLNTWEVTGTKGSIAALRFDTQGTQSVPIYLINEDSEVTIIDCEPGAHFAPEFENFANSIRGYERPHISPEDSMNNARLLELIGLKSKMN